MSTRTDTSTERPTLLDDILSYGDHIAAAAVASERGQRATAAAESQAAIATMAQIMRRLDDARGQ